MLSSACLVGSWNRAFSQYNSLGGYCVSVFFNFLFLTSAHTKSAVFSGSQHAIYTYSLYKTIYSRHLICLTLLLEIIDIHS